MDGSLWELYGGVLAQNSPEGMFHFMRLPAVSRGIAEKSWKVPPQSFNVRDFGMDPSQDLLVLIEQPQWSGHPPVPKNFYSYSLFQECRDEGERQPAPPPLPGEEPRHSSSSCTSERRAVACKDGSPNTPTRSFIHYHHLWRFHWAPG